MILWLLYLRFFDNNTLSWLIGRLCFNFTNKSNTLNWVDIVWCLSNWFFNLLVWLRFRFNFRSTIWFLDFCRLLWNFISRTTWWLNCLCSRTTWLISWTNWLNIFFLFRLFSIWFDVLLLIRLKLFFNLSSNWLWTASKE